MTESQKLEKEKFVKQQEIFKREQLVANKAAAARILLNISLSLAAGSGSVRVTTGHRK